MNAGAGHAKLVAKAATRVDPSGGDVPTTRKILVPMDFSECSELALETAIEVAERSGGILVLFHSLRTPVEITFPEGMVAPAVVADFRKTALDRLQCHAERARTRGRTVETHIAEGIPWLGIAAEADAIGAELIVMGTHGNTGLKHVLLGSVAERTIRSAPCPVLTVKTRSSRADRAGAVTIVVPVDFSETSKRAVETARALADRIEVAHVILVHALQVPVASDPLAAEQIAGLELHLSTCAKEELERGVAALTEAGISAESYSRVGNPGVVAVDVARERHADLLVIGTHGHTGVTHLLLGSVAERVVRTADCPVLTVRLR